MNVSAIAILTAIGFLMAKPADAYVDPGTGGMLIQLIAGGTAGLAVLMKLYWRRLRETLSGSGSSAAAGAPSSSASSSADDRG
jgi:hypothetical protein